MQRQLKGIALILFGIMLTLVCVVIEPFYAGDNYTIWCYAGVACGAAGLTMTFTKDKKQANPNSNKEEIL